jgi:hypothetical protein
MATQVFISWSGELSKKLAEAVREWLPATLQFVKPYFTPVDIEKGAKWMSDISGELSKSHVGIICLNRENLSSPWILFEAGALSKNLDRSRVCPLLFGLEPAEVEGPLSVFQATRFTREDFKGLVETINNAGGDSKLDKRVLENVFEKWWPGLKEQVDKIQAEHPPADENARRPVEDMVQEILELVRLQVRRQRSRVADEALHTILGGRSEESDSVSTLRRALDLEDTLECLGHRPSEYPSPIDVRGVLLKALGKKLAHNISRSPQEPSPLPDSPSEPA